MYPIIVYSKPQASRGARTIHNSPPPPVIYHNNSRYLDFRFLKFILIALAFLLPFTSSAQNTPYTANSHATLNNAILAANNNGLGLDTINITGNITLSSDLSTIFSVVTINGNGHTINGGGEHTAITMGGSHGNVTINNLTFAQNKGAASYHGGAIYYPGGVSLTLDNVTIRNSSTSGSDANGGGLLCAGPSLTIKNSRIHHNSAHEGGGLFLGNGCTGARIINSSIYNNNSAGGSVALGGGASRAKSGGGIHVAGGASVTISGSRIYNNTAGTAVGINTAGSGGGIGAYGSSSSAATVTINSSSIYNNLAYEQGGGLYMNGRTTLNVSGSAFYGNDAKSGAGAGGGLALKNEPSSAATHTITNTSIFNNTASGRGGGIFATMNYQSAGTTSVVTLRHVTISGNTSSLTGTHQGGGLYATQTVVTLQNSIVFGNTGDGSASNCIFSGLPTASQSAALTPRLAHNIIGPGSTGGTTNQAHCTANADPSDPQLVAPSVHRQGNFFIPRAGSPAIDTIPNASCLSSVTTDQRGQPRPQPPGGSCDKGAIEHPGYVPPPPPSNDGGASGSSASGSSKERAVSLPTAMPRASTCLTLNGVWTDGITQSTECQRVSGVAIGNEEIAASAVDAVDVWGWVLPNTQICFFASGGSFKFIDTGVIPRVVYDLLAYSQNGMSCATIDRAGILALLPGAAPPPLAASSAAAEQTQALSNCMVRTTALLNFRDGPGGEVIGALPYDVTLTAMEKSGGWFKVDYHGEQGWISADYVVPKGSCGG